MRDKAVALALVLLACAFWAGLVLLVNRKPPDSTNQAVFLLMWGTAVATTAIPLSYAVNTRLAGLYGAYGILSRATRQGLLAGVLATALMVLRFLRVLTPLNAAALVLAVVMIEAVIGLRNR